MAIKTLEDLKSSFTELSAQRDAILAESTPLRELRDKTKNEALAKAKEIDDQVKIIEKDLFEISMALGHLSRALGGKQMSDGK